MFVTESKTRMTQNPTIGKNIKMFREQMGLTQESVAAFLGIKREVVSYYETAAREVPVEELLKLSDLFGCEVSNLIEENNDTLNACLAFAFRADQLESSDLQSIADFKKIVKNYLSLISLQTNAG